MYFYPFKHESVRLAVTNEAATEFIRTYLEAVQDGLSVFPENDRHLFPAYTRNARRVVVYLSSKNGVGFVVGRKAREWHFTVRPTQERIERAVGLPVETKNYFHFDNWVNCTIARMTIAREAIRSFGSFVGGTVLVFPDELGIAELVGDSDVRFVDVRFAFVSAGKPHVIETPLLWLFSYTRDLDLTHEDALKRASSAVASLVISAALRVDPERVSSTSLEILANALGQTRSKFLNLVRRTDVEEQEIQDFLAARSFFLDPEASTILEKRPIGRYFTDFVLLYPDGSYRLVELERPHDDVVKDSDLSKRARHAARQVRDWMSWLNGHPDPRFSGTPRRHWVVIGMEERMSPTDVKTLVNLNAENTDLEIRTFDALAENLAGRARALFGALQWQLRGPIVRVNPYGPPIRLHWPEAGKDEGSSGHP